MMGNQQLCCALSPWLWSPPRYLSVAPIAVPQLMTVTLFMINHAALTESRSLAAGEPGRGWILQESFEDGDGRKGAGAN